MRQKKRFVLTTTALVAGLAHAAPAFDGQIRNNTLAVDPAETLALVAKSDSEKVHVYDLRHGKLLRTLEGFISPRNILFSPDGKHFYVSDSTKGVVEKWDSPSLKRSASMAVGPGAFGTALSRDGSRLFVNNQASSTVTTFDPNTLQPLSVMTGFAQPRQGIKLSPDDKALFVTNFLGDKITVIDPASFKTLAEVGGFNKIRAISISRDGKMLYAANSGTDTLSEVDVEARRVLRSVKVGSDPYGAALRPDGNFLYSGNLKGNSMTIVSLPDFKATGEITGLKGPRQAITFSKDSRKAWVLNEDLSVAEVDLDTRQVIRTLSAGT
ncbi:YncE family protein [Crenobacter cavernae]|uniref:Phosphate ABC transporter substrate-binding protein n=1 Tax=Crenobacter cavernae TaxID=2290923 RepID=A0A345Y212_9NEIS|nr:beta-propeller fold lactonase family protein [Crenobacter cavernae]AXK37964.1 phosphate ABC transporter substrate-binding protein [Crenobacter cavernae]